MKRCPLCQRAYEDNSQAFCFTDGARLVEEGQAYDSQRTMVAPPPPPPGAQPPDSAQYYRQDKQTGPASPYPTQGNQPAAWPQSGAQPGQQSWPAATPPPPQQSTGWGTPQQQSPYQGGAPFVSTGAQADKRRGLAIAGLVFGVLSIQDALFIFFRWIYPFSTIRAVTFLIAFTGLILGAVALTLATTNPTRHTGRGFAIAGMVTSFLSLFLILVRGGF